MKNMTTASASPRALSAWLHGLSRVLPILALGLTPLATQAQDTTSPNRITVNRYTKMGARTLAVTTTANRTYNYLIMAPLTPTLLVPDSQLCIGSDVFLRSQIKSIRILKPARYTLNEDSVRFDKTRTLDFGIVALRHSMQQGQWNSIVLPFSLTGQQLRLTFGDDVQLASVRGITDEQGSTLEFGIVDTQAEGNVLTAGVHYLIKPSAAPDVTADNTLYNFEGSTRIPGPVYVIPGVSISSNVTSRISTYNSPDMSLSIRTKGTFNRLDGTDFYGGGRVSRNKKVEPGATILTPDGVFEQQTDSTVMPAFRFWIETMTGEGPIHFVVRGAAADETLADLTSAIFAPATDADERTARGIVYDLQGRIVGQTDDTHTIRQLNLPDGIYILRGKKYIIRH